jgi:hypothetical protein
VRERDDGLLGVEAVDLIARGKGCLRKSLLDIRPRRQDARDARAVVILEPQLDECFREIGDLFRMEEDRVGDEIVVPLSRVRTGTGT